MSDTGNDSESEAATSPDLTPNESVAPGFDEQAKRRRRSRRASRDAEEFRHTRISAVWAAVFVAVLFGVALVDFIAQNTRDVRINFFSVSGRMPGAVALLAAALAGAIVVLAVGVCRVAQLRFNIRRQRRRAASENVASASDDDGAIARGEEDPPGRP